MTRISDLHKKWLKKPAYRAAYESLEKEYAIASAVIGLRARAGLTQEELAQRMGTTQPVIARLESGRIRPSISTLERLAKATGSRLLVSFEPIIPTPKKKEQKLIKLTKELTRLPTNSRRTA